MAKSLGPSAKREADALLTALCMSERHKHWNLFHHLLGYVEAAGGRVSYQGPCTYAIEVPLKTSSKT